MKKDEQKPKQSPNRRQDEIYFSSIPVFYQDQKKMKEDLDNIVRRKEGK
jgi:hypothetical protein